MTNVKIRLFQKFVYYFIHENVQMYHFLPEFLYQKKRGVILDWRHDDITSQIRITTSRSAHLFQF